MPGSNELYLAVLPLIHISNNHILGFGLTEEVLTLFPHRDFAGKFAERDADVAIQTFLARQKYLTGNAVIGYDLFKEPVPGGLFIVRVIQHIS